MQICALQRSLICDGIPFACIQDGKYKKYGFTNNREFEEVQYRRKVRMLTEIKAGIKYLNDGDSIKKIGEKFTVECNKQIAYVDEATR